MVARNVKLILTATQKQESFIAAIQQIALMLHVMLTISAR